HSRQRNRGRITQKRNFENTSGKNENLERRRRRKQRSDEHSSKSILLHPAANRLRSRARLAVEKRFSARFRDEVEQNTTRNRAESSKKRIKRHSFRMPDRKINQQKIIDDGKR